MRKPSQKASSLFDGVFNPFDKKRFLRSILSLMASHLVISDIHRDVISLKTLLERYSGQFEDIWCLGDVAGHGEHLNGTGNVNECYSILNGYYLNKKLSYVAGNWEKWLCMSIESLAKKRPDELSEVNKARQSTDQASLDWINSWDWLTPKEGDFTLTHGWIESLNYEGDRDPWEAYLYKRYDDEVTKAFLCGQISTPHALVGHTHNPGFFLYNGKNSTWHPMTLDMVGKEKSYIDSHGGVPYHYVLNPGAVSGARDAEYKGLRTAIILNTEEKFFRFIAF